MSLLHITGCEKEYSYEGGDTAIVKKDSAQPVVPDFPNCSGCKINEALQEEKWNFKTGNSYLCGNITKGILTFEKNAFTFFGPSACSLDSGLVITAYLAPLKLDADMFNVKVNKVAFYYYDHTATSYIFMSQSTSDVSLTIDSYIKSTGIATGTFSGQVLRSNGQPALIKEGRFKMRLG